MAYKGGGYVSGIEQGLHYEIIDGSTDFPYPLLYGEVIDENITEVIVNDPKNNLQVNGHIIEISRTPGMNRDMQIWFATLNESVSSVEIEGLSESGEVVFYEDVDRSEKFSLTYEQEAEEKFKDGFGIYLADSGELLLSDAHIVAFNSVNNTFELNEIGIERWNSHLDFQTIPKLNDSLFSQDFVIIIEGTEIAKGKFWSSVSSGIYSGIVILDALIKLDSNHNTIRLGSGYPHSDSLEENINSKIALYFVAS